jgi:serine/threonine-protein kinase HipA
MARPSTSRALGVWANGMLVGRWVLPSRGAMAFTYDQAWVEAKEARPLSLSMPINLDQLTVTGHQVSNYFDNLLPDSEAIRRRIQSRYGIVGRSPFDLLAAIGRDCVGAIQLLPVDEQPTDVFSIAVTALSEARVERMLQGVQRPSSQSEDDEALRISLAGAQEKTALTRHRGRWCLPHGSTPTTHIFKLPLGLVGNRALYLTTSVENEWLCSRILAAFGLPVAECQLAQFGDVKALIVTRFDRKLHHSRGYWLRLPQEDFCQVTGTPSENKYESEGGPGLVQISKILQSSDDRDADLATLLQAQLLFWMLAATDGHAKNFSLHLLAGGSFRLTPLYDSLRRDFRLADRRLKAKPASPEEAQAGHGLTWQEQALQSNRDSPRSLQHDRSALRPRARHERPDRGHHRSHSKRSRPRWQRLPRRLPCDRVRRGDTGTSPRFWSAETEGVAGCCESSILAAHCHFAAMCRQTGVTAGVEASKCSPS